ncbi:MAG: peptidase T4 [Alphaproteobacteria bacterium HGW-Alphaproteobacteria-12]|nr:MAG: peptidase T4 [Alphaproteobacteria bacterium HGW-Alphaproteobacteria-12]
MYFGAIRKGPRNHIGDVGGIAVGNAEDIPARTGVTVLLPETRAVAGVDVRGGGPGTRETDALDPVSLVDEVDGVVLSGGSSWGIEAASGVLAWLGVRERGFRAGSSPLVSPIVPAAILFDLANGGDKGWGEEPPYRALGRAACESAATDFALGNAGAGLGAIAGQYKGGLGSASALTESGLAVGALMVANPFGAVVMPGSGCFWAAPYELDGEFGARGWPDPLPAFAALDPFAGSKADIAPGSNTTIGVVATNADLTPVEARRVAIMAQDGLARAIRPVHTPVDGDTVFVLATGGCPLGAEARYRIVTGIGALAADCVARAIARGVHEAASLGNAPSWRARHEA